MRSARAVLRRDRAFRPLLDTVGSLNLRRSRPYFWVLCCSILSQQVSGAAARTIIGRVKALYPQVRFPTPEAILRTKPQSFRAAGVSRQKARYLYALAEEFDSGSLKRVRFSKLDDDQIISRLTDIVGVGRWTAEMFLMFSMRRPDVFPIGDLGIRRGMELYFGIEDKEEMIERAEEWRPFRTVASVYLWRAQAAVPV